MRLSAYIASKYALSRRYAKAAIREGRVNLNGRVLSADVEADPRLDYRLDLPCPAIQYSLVDYIVKEAGDVLFLYKPPFMHTERQRPEDPLCLDDVLSGSFPGYRLASRLDFGVDGLLPALRKGSVISVQHKDYLAWVEKAFPEKAEGRWDVDADGRKRVKAFASEDGIFMSFERMKEGERADLIKISLELAHRHQVRAVCAALGHPIIGDSLYGNGDGKGRIFLHCASVNINGVFCESPKLGDFISCF